MTLNELSTRRSTANGAKALLQTVRDGASTDGDAPETPIAARITAATRAVRDAAALGLGAPISVNVTEHGCTAVMDTETVLAWARLADPRPIWVTYPDHAYLRLDAVIGGVPWQLHNGVPAPTSPVPTPRPRTRTAVSA